MICRKFVVGGGRGAASWSSGHPCASFVRTASINFLFADESIVGRPSKVLELPQPGYSVLHPQDRRDSMLDRVLPWPMEKDACKATDGICFRPS